MGNSKYSNDDKQLYESRNTDNVFIRNIVGGLLNVLNNRLKYTQVWSDTETETVNVPFFYNLGTNDERLIQDNFMFFQDVCDWPIKIDGNFDSFPRGYITLNSSSIEASNICNRFVLGEYTKKEGDVFNTYVAYLYALPMRLEFTADIICDTHITMLKIEQAIRELFYKNKTFFVLFKGMKLRCRMGIADSSTLAAPIEHKMASDYGENSKPKLSFSFTVMTYHPVFDESTEVRADSYIKEIAYDVSFLDKDNRPTVGLFNEDNTKYHPVNFSYYNRTRKLEFNQKTKDLVTNKVFSADQIVPLEWDYFKDDGDMRSIIINAIDSKTGELTLLKNIKNQTYLDWRLADNFNSDLQSYFDISFSSKEDIQVYTLPKLAVVPDLETKYITAESFKIIDPGYIMSPRDCQLDFTLLYNKKTYNGKINIKDGCVFAASPVSFKSKIKFKEELYPHNFSLILLDAEDPDNNDKILNVTVV